MMWYNSKTNELQSHAPWVGYLHPDLIKERYSDWKEVPTDFVPPVPPPTKQELYAEVNTAYSTKEEQILKAISQAQARGDTGTVTKLNATFVANRETWKNKLLEIKSQ